MAAIASSIAIIIKFVNTNTLINIQYSMIINFTESTVR